MSNEIERDIHRTISEARQKFESEIQKFYHAHLDIVRNNIPKEEKAKQITELIKKYTNQQDDETLRNAQREHKNNDSPLARNKHIIQAELRQHIMNYDDNWDHNQDQANGKYTLKKKEEWLAKKAKLESELKQVD